MGIIRFTKKIFKPLVNFPKWMDLPTIIATGKNIHRSAKELFSIQNATHTETFEQAIERLHLTEEDLKLKSKSCKILASFYLGIAICIMIYMIFLVSHKDFLNSLFALIIAGIPLTLAFREHFWYFQIQKRKLGCSLRAWVTFLFSSHKR